MNQYTFELICRKCGKQSTRQLSQSRQLSQFDELPRCNECDQEMLVENVTTTKEGKENGKS
jgi:NAD-dependent SIR2 family protein deacetylase